MKKFFLLSLNVALIAFLSCSKGSGDHTHTLEDHCNPAVGIETDTVEMPDKAFRDFVDSLKNVENLVSAIPGVRHCKCNDLKDKKHPIAQAHIHQKAQVLPSSSNPGFPVGILLITETNKNNGHEKVCYLPFVNVNPNLEVCDHIREGFLHVCSSQGQRPLAYFVRFHSREQHDAGICN